MANRSCTHCGKAFVRACESVSITSLRGHNFLYCRCRVCLLHATAPLASSMLPVVRHSCVLGMIELNGILNNFINYVVVRLTETGLSNFICSQRIPFKMRAVLLKIVTWHVANRMASYDPSARAGPLAVCRRLRPDKRLSGYRPICKQL